jgi:hypothetical protein
MRFASLALSSLIAVSSQTALADGEVQSLMTPADKALLEKFVEKRTAALDEIRDDTSAEAAELKALLAKPELSTADFDFSGDWRCRTIKIGGLLPLTVYSWFKCRMSDDGAGWKLEKLTGSQRTTGRFYDDSQTRMIYLGSGSFNDDKPLPYGSGPDTDQVGYAYRTGDSEWRIEFPAPRYESHHDILQLER